MKRPPAWLLACALLLLALVTNRWPGWESGIRYLQASDVALGYLPVAMAAPGLPTEPIAFHHAQRFFFPYVLGAMAKGMGIGIPALFGIASIVMQTLLLGLFWLLLGHLQLPPSRRLLAWALFVIQPYALRYYWIVPGMVSDLGFDLGVVALLLGLVRRRSAPLWIGLTLAALSRQTALLLLPGATLWILRDTRWSHRWPLALVAAAWTIALYLGTGLVAATFATVNQNSDHLLGLFLWLRSPDFTARALAEHTLRCVLPLLPAAVLLLGEARPSRWPLAGWCGVLMAGAIAAQPFLAGPLVTGQNAARLVTLGLAPLVLAWGASAREDWPPKLAALLVAVLFLGSFHHLYTWVGPGGPGGTALLQLVVVLALAAAAAWQGRRRVA